MSFYFLFFISYGVDIIHKKIWEFLCHIIQCIHYIFQCIAFCSCFFSFIYVFTIRWRSHVMNVSTAFSSTDSMYILLYVLYVCTFWSFGFSRLSNSSLSSRRRRHHCPWWEVGKCVHFRCQCHRAMNNGDTRATAKCCVS